MAQDTITTYVRAGDPVCQALLSWLDQRGIAYTARDVTKDPGASAVLFGRLGRVQVPVTQVGDRLLVGFDPMQLARFLPPPEDESAGVSFGAAVRTVTAEIAAAATLPATYGVEVGPVREGSPAETAGIRRGDLITEIGAYTLVGGRDQFVTAVSGRRPGDTMELTVWREGTAQAVAVHFPMPELEAETVVDPAAAPSSETPPA